MSLDFDCCANNCTRIKNIYDWNTAPNCFYYQFYRSIANSVLSSECRLLVRPERSARLEPRFCSRNPCSLEQTLLWESGIAGDRSRRSTSHPKRGHKSSCLHWGSVVAFCGCVKSRFFRFGIQNENALQLYGRFRMKIELWFPAGFWAHGWFNKHCCKQRRCISRRWECYLTFRMMCYQPPRKPYLESFLLQTLFIQYSQSKI